MSNLPVSLLVIDALACPPVKPTVAALDVRTCALSFLDGQVLRGVGSTKRAADRSKLGHVRFPKRVDSLNATEFRLVSPAMDSPAFFVI